MSTTSAPPPQLQLPASLLTSPSSPTFPTHVQQTLLADSALLHLLHHRNKNQHRRSLWYRHFSSFRRELQRLLSDLSLSLPNPAQPSTTTPSAARNPHTKSPPSHRINLTTTRLHHWAIHYHLLPTWHAAFTHLIASTQYAPLGLVLLGILARVCGLTGLSSHFALLGAHREGEDARRAEEEEERVRGAREAEAEREGEAYCAVLERWAREEGGVLVRGGLEVDLGTVVKRSEVVGVGRGVVVGDFANGKEDGSTVETSMEVKTGMLGNPRAPKRSRIEVTAPLASTSSVPSSVEDELATLKEHKRMAKDEQQPQQKKMKKKKKKLNAIDALFAAL